MRSIVTVGNASACTVHRFNGPLFSRRSARIQTRHTNHTYIFMQTSVRMVKNEDNSLHFFSTEDLTGMHSVPCKVSCNVCRSPLFDEGRNTVLAYPSSFRFPEHKVPLDFQPTAHIFYSQRYAFSVLYTMLDAHVRECQSHGDSRRHTQVGRPQGRE